MKLTVNKLQKQFLIFSALTALSANAFAITGMDAGILGGVSYSNPAVQNSAGSAHRSSSPSSIIGGYYNIEFLPEFSLDTGFSYFDRKFDQQSTSYKYSNISINSIARYWIMPGVSLGAGPYFSHAVGDLKTSSKSQSLASAGIKSNDLGATLSMQMKVPLFGRIQPILDVRYNYGLTDLDKSNTSGNKFKNKDLQILMGIGYFFF